MFIAARLSQSQVTADITPASSGISALWPFAPLPDGGILVCNGNDIIHLDADNNNVGTIFTKSTSWISGLTLIENDVLVLHANGVIVRVNILSGTVVSNHNVAGSLQLRKCSILDSTMILCVDWELNEVLTFDLGTDTKQVVVNSGCLEPKEVHRCTDCGPNTINIVSCAGDNKIVLYDEAWSVIKAFGGWSPGYGTGTTEFKNVNEFILSPDKTLFVSDQYNFRIQELTSDLQYVRTLLDSTDGVLEVWAVSFSYPYLWLIFDENPGPVRHLKKYQIYNN